MYYQMLADYYTLTNLLLVGFWFLSVLLDYAGFCYTWQLKEYRIDRFRDFLSTEQGKNYIVFNYTILWRSIILVMLFFWPINSIETFKYVVLALFIFDFLRGTYKFFKRNLKRPKPTKKALLLVVMAMIIEGVILVSLHSWFLIVLLVILRFFLFSFLVIIMIVPTKVIKEIYIKKATKKLAKYKNLMVIGITGSYAKTTTKTFLAHILGHKFKVISTPKNNNTEIGVAQFILRTNFKDKDIFVVEMGAYKMGEIKKICDMVQPKIGILTAIIEQHLSLFGSIENIQKTKYELLRALPKDGLAVVNSDNPYCTQFLDELECSVKTFGTDEDNNPNALGLEIKNVEGGIKIKGRLEGREGELFAPVVGKHNAANISPCLLVALYLGVDVDLVTKAVGTLKLPEKNLNIYSYGSCTIIDDSYNANVEGFMAALDIIAKYPSDKKRIVITRGVLELGEKSYKAHQRLGEEIAYCCDELVLVTRDFVEPFVEGVGKKFNAQVVIKISAKDQIEYLRSIKNTNAVILLENRLIVSVWKEISQENNKTNNEDI